MYCCIYAPGNGPVLIDCAKRFSPLIEEQFDLVIFDIDGLEALHGPPETIAQAVAREAGIEANIAIASNPDAAMHAARGLSGITVMRTGEEGTVLANLPLNLLGGSPDFAESLDRWGVRTFGAFAALPSDGIAARLGEEGVGLQELARGEGNRRLRVRSDTRIYEAEMELDSPVELLESVCFILARLLDEVLTKLAPLATNELYVTLTLDRSGTHAATLRLPVPMRDAKALLKMLHLELSATPPPDAVVKVTLRAEPVEPRRTQRGLFAATSPEAARLETTLARVRHLVGKEHVGSPRLVNTFRPDRFVMDPFVAPPEPTKVATSQNHELRLCLRRYRPPCEAEVKTENKRPVHLYAAKVHGPIISSRGPWRTSGNWWSEDVWNRDRWDVVLESGVLFRIFNQLDSGGWYVEGTYD